MKAILPANRVAALSTWLSALGVLIVGVTQTLPSGWQNTAAIVAGLAAKAAVSTKFLTGASAHETASLYAGPSASTTSASVVSDEEEFASVPA